MKHDEHIESFDRKELTEGLGEQQTDVQPEQAVEQGDPHHEPEKRTPTVTPQEATIELARRGRKNILPKLRQVLDEHPELWQHFGNLALQSQESWIGLIAGKDLYLAETLRRHLDAMRTELAGPNPSPLDRLLIDRILACHVQALYFDAMETTDPTADNMRVARYRMDRRDQAHKHFLSAVKMLATVRNLVARTQTIQVQLVNPPMVYSPPTPMTPVDEGDGLETHGMSTARPATPINRVTGAMGGGRGNRIKRPGDRGGELNIGTRKHPRRDMP